jgi:hypothetical protein
MPSFLGLFQLLLDRRRSDPSEEPADLGERESHLTLWRAQDLARGNHLLLLIWRLYKAEIRYYDIKLELIGRGEGAEASIGLSFVLKSQPIQEYGFETDHKCDISVSQFRSSRSDETEQTSCCKRKSANWNGRTVHICVRLDVVELFASRY